MVYLSTWVRAERSVLAVLGTEMLGSCAADFGKMWGPDTQTRIKQTRVLIIDEVRSLPPHTNTTELVASPACRAWADFDGVW